MVWMTFQKNQTLNGIDDIPEKIKHQRVLMTSQKNQTPKGIDEIPEDSKRADGRGLGNALRTWTRRRSGLRGTQLLMQFALPP